MEQSHNWSQWCPFLQPSKNDFVAWNFPEGMTRQDITNIWPNAARIVYCRPRRLAFIAFTTADIPQHNFRIRIDGHEHEISVAPNPSRINCIQLQPTVVTVNELRQFMERSGGPNLMAIVTKIVILPCATSSRPHVYLLVLLESCDDCL